MTELHWNFGWTMATLGVCWLVLSCVVALGIGQIIKRGKVSADADQSASLGAQRGLPQQLMTVDSINSQQHELEDDGLPAPGYGSRSASGMRLKAVVLDQELEKTARKVS